MLVACILARKFICKHVYIINKHVLSKKIIVKKSLDVSGTLIFLFFNLKNVIQITVLKIFCLWERRAGKGIHSYLNVILYIRVIFQELK